MGSFTWKGEKNSCKARINTEAEKYNTPRILQNYEIQLQINYKVQK